MTREEKVIEARAYFNRMPSHIHNVVTVEGLYAATIRRYVAEGVTTWEELGFEESDVAKYVYQAKLREASASLQNMSNLIQQSSSISTPLLDKFENRYSQKPIEAAEKILFGVIGDLTGRKGLDNEWDNIDAETKEELLQRNLKLIKQSMGSDNEEWFEDPVLGRVKKP